jgi:hypothetical protein
MCIVYHMPGALDTTKVLSMTCPAEPPTDLQLYQPNPSTMPTWSVGWAECLSATMRSTPRSNRVLDISGSLQIHSRMQDINGLWWEREFVLLGHLTGYTAARE